MLPQFSAAGSAAGCGLGVFLARWLARLLGQGCGIVSWEGREEERDREKRGGDGSKSRWQVVVLEAAAVWKVAVQ